MKSPFAIFTCHLGFPDHLLHLLRIQLFSGSLPDPEIDATVPMHAAIS